MSTLKRYIQDFKLVPVSRVDLEFSDDTKIHMYADPKRTGVRLRAFANVPAQKMEFPVDTSAWRQQTLATVPAARYRHAVAYDSTRKVLVLFGGRGSSGLLGDTWEYDGLTWAQVSTSGPSAREDHVMGFDSDRGVVVLHGGDDAGGLSDETWEWNGTAWSQVIPTTTTPAARRNHGMVWDSAHDQLIMVGGLTGGGVTGDTWLWDGTDWTLLAASIPSLSREGFSLAFDSYRGVVVLFGGNDGSGQLSDTWEWHSVKGWIAKSVDGPAARTEAVLVYDPLLRLLVLFGGWDGTATLGDTATFDGSKWSTLAITSPSARQEGAAAYLDHLRLALLFGGNSGSELAEHWEHLPDAGQTVKLKRWSPASVKSWAAFEEISSKPDGTEILWQLEDDTSPYFFNGSAWAVATALDWNTEDEIADNISSFSAVGKTIRPVARLFTADRFATPVLKEHRVMMNGLFDSWEDFINSIVESFKSATSFRSPRGRKLTAATTSFNLFTDDLWQSNEPLTIVGVDGVYNHDTDPDHSTDLLSSFNASTGQVTLSGSVPAGTRLWAELVVSPPIVINYANSEYIEVARVPAVVVDTIAVRGVDETSIKRDLVHKSAGQGYRMENPLLCCEITLGIAVLTGDIRAWTRLLSVVQDLPRALGGFLTSKALDVKWTLDLGRRLLSYNPKPLLSDLKAATFDMMVSDVHMWLSDVQDKPVVQEFITDIRRKEVVGPFVTSKPQRPAAGAIANIQPFTEIETG